VRVIVCGVRGSTPAPGVAFVRYGGNTSSVAIGHDDGRVALILDAGTGIRRVTDLLGGRPFLGTILLTHLHWDHTQGIPFFRAGDRDDARVRLVMPAQGDPKAVLARAMSPPHFAIDPDGLRGEWSFQGLEPGEHRIEGFRIRALEIPHKGGRTFGYRIEDGKASIAYLSDHSPFALGPGPEGFGEYHDGARELARGVDLLLHDAQYTAEDFRTFATYGHATIDYAVGLASVYGAARVLLFHHAPDRTDEQLDAIVRSYAGNQPPVAAAAEGLVINLPGETSGVADA
jgi:phosphoribosyl 1,2-cyclic phosphodiesterase